jgi:hypothetical protein
MTLPTNDDFANCELSVEELDAVAGGWPGWVHSAVNSVEHGLKSFFTNPVVWKAGLAFVIVGGLLTGGSTKNQLN